MKRVLFVDDEPLVLQGIRRMLHAQRHEWDISFATSGEEAIGLLDARPVDVVVSDMKMPGMTGATLLSQIRDRHPETVRIILSGHSELEMALQSVPLAHHYLGKPTDGETIRGVVTRALDLNGLLQDEALRRDVGKLGKLPSLPKTYAALVAALSDPDCAAAEVAPIIERDVSLSAKLLHVANGAFFGRATPTTNVREAISYLGVTMVKNLTLMVEVFETSAGEGVGGGLSLQRLADHALMVANASFRILEGADFSRQAFTAGLLHDVGKVVVARCPHGGYAEVVRKAIRSEKPLHVAEAGTGRPSHAEIGAYLLALWGIPFPIVEAVAHHHNPASVAPSELDLVTAVHVADRLVHEVAPSFATEADIPPPLLDEGLLERLDLSRRLPEWRAAVQGLAGVSTAEKCGDV